MRSPNKAWLERHAYLFHPFWFPFRAKRSSQKRSVSIPRLRSLKQISGKLAPPLERANRLLHALQLVKLRKKHPWQKRSPERQRSELRQWLHESLAHSRISDVVRQWRQNASVEI